MSSQLKRFLVRSLIFFFTLTLYACGSGSGGGGSGSGSDVTTPATTYAVIYSANGGAGGTVPVDTARYSQGQTVTVLWDSGNLVRPGFSFSGWNTAADQTGATYLPGQILIIGSSDLTLYAIWTTNPTFLVSYDGNGANGGAAPIDSTHYETGQTVVALGNTGNLVRSGYMFVGWNTRADGSGTTYTQNQTLTMGSANVTLYAVWIDNPPVAVMIDGNSLTAVSQLDMGLRQIIPNPNVSFQVLKHSSSGQDSYSISLNSGSVPGYRFITDLQFVGMNASFTPVTRTISGFTINEYIAYATNVGDVFTVALQTLPASDFHYAGMANWKYLGGLQSGYWTGYKIATGSFIFGDQTQPTVVDSIPTATYLGYVQASGEAYVYYDSYDQLAAKVSVALDRTAGTIAVSITNIEYWINSVWMNSPLYSTKIANFLSGVPSVQSNPQSLSCVAPILPTSNFFSCDVTGQAANGKIIGRYFGPNGEEVAGTFAFSGMFESQNGQSVAGAFVAKR